MTGSRLVYGLDASEYTGEIPRSTFARLYDDGYRVFLPQIWGGGYDTNRANRHLGQHVRASRAEGFHVNVGYVWPPRDVTLALNFLEEQEVELPSIALDVEAGAGILDWMVTEIRESGRNPVVYASPGSWSNIMGRTTRYRDLDLWAAGYPIRRLNSYDPTTIQTNLASASRYLFGGWTLDKVIAWQFQNTTDMRGEQFDLNLCREEAFLVAGNAELERLAALQSVMALFLEAAAKAGQGEKPKKETQDMIKYLIASWG